MRSLTSSMPETLVQSSRWRLPWFGLGLTGIFLLSAGLRFWGLGRFNALVFDEVYYAKFAAQFLLGRQEFGGHPPLSTYIIAIGIWIAQQTPLNQGLIKNGLTGLLLTPLSYRWLDALTGSVIPLVIAAIAYQVSKLAGENLDKRRAYALIAGLFAALDGFFLVESRYALINIYMVIFGLLGQWLALLALSARSAPGRSPLKFNLYLGLAGACFGASVAVKWNGLGFLLGLYGLWGAAWLMRWRSTRETAVNSEKSGRSPFALLRSLSIGHGVLHLAIVPALTYYLAWIPYIRLDPSVNFWQWHVNTLDYHSRIGGGDVHPYCSPWFSWIVMYRPIAYFFKSAHAVGEPAPVVGPPLPEGTGKIFYDVHAIGNPLLWWLGAAAVLLMLGFLLFDWGSWISGLIPGVARSPQSAITGGDWMAHYLVINWAANWLPWMLVSRCVFLYLYMPSLVFSMLAIAWLVNRWLWSTQPHYRTIGIVTIGLIVAAFVFWLPFYLGLPLSPNGLSVRRWMRSWI